MARFLVDYPAGVVPGTPQGKALRTPKYSRPVSKLKKALYGHPDAGTLWETHCHLRLLKNGFNPITHRAIIIPDWPLC